MLSNDILKMAAVGMGSAFGSNLFSPKEFAIIPMSRFKELEEKEQQLERYRNTKRRYAKRIRGPHKRHG